jgi:aminomethyltransferase
VRDDALVYRFGPQKFIVVVNAANTAKIVDWARQHLEPGTTFTDVSSDVALLAVQGPRSLETLASSRLLGDLPRRLGDLPYYHFVTAEVGGDPITISRTGYTGERGYELFLPPHRAGDLWSELLDRGGRLGIGPAGLGARDTLRFEVCFCLYGHELGEEVSPLEAGIGWTVKLQKQRFIGMEALVRQKAAGLPRKLVGVELPSEARAIARQGFEVRSGGRCVGQVTSGTWSPTLERSLALVLVETSAAAGPLDVVVRGREVRAKAASIPFHRPVARD